MNEDNNTVKATVVGVTSVTPIASSPIPDDSMTGILKETMQTITDVINEFSDEINEKPASPKDEAKVEGAKEDIKSFMDYIKSDGFKENINEKAEKYDVPPKKVAENFFEKALGTVADVLGLAVTTAGNAVHALINLLSTVLHSTTNIIVKVASALVSIVTLNKSCHA